MTRIISLFLSLSLVLFCITGCAQKKGGKYITVAFYNCENFFDPGNDPAKDDDDFTPGGKYHYTQKIYEQKLHNIASVIRHMNDDNGPAVLGMAEVENNIVLNDLVHESAIAGKGYKYEWFEGPDPRGINVALLYDPAVFKVLHSEPLPVNLSAIDSRSKTRDILYVRGVLAGDTVHLLVNHWPSRRGGADDSEPKRAIAAQTNKLFIAGIEHKYPGSKIIVMGDLNDNPDNNSITNVLGVQGDKTGASDNGFYDPWLGLYKRGEGTEAFQHSWNLFDQIILSGNFLKKNGHKLTYDRAEIFKPDFIIDKYKGHEGEPHRSFAGTHWINGFSDHFPVITYFTN